MNIKPEISDYQLVLIDFDGTIVKNSLHLACKVLFEVLRNDTGIPYDTIERFVKISNSFSPEDSFPFFFKSVGLDFLQRDVRDKIRYKVESNFNANDITQGFREFITHLRENSIEFRIFSLAHSSRIVNSLDYIEKSDIYNFRTSKADLKTFRTLLENMKQKAESIVYIEDDPLALNTAKTVKINTILMRNSFFNDLDVNPYEQNIDFIVNDFLDFRSNI